MKIVSHSFLLAATVLLTGSHAFAQFQTASHCNCHSGVAAEAWSGFPAGQCDFADGACYTDGSGACCSGNCHAGHGCRSHGCLGCLCAGKGYQDAGWAPPARLPVNRDRIWYHTWHPQAFYGSQGGGFIANYPQVYQPSDTTQLGYSYQTVPTWQSRPGMIPLVPNPSDFHSRVTPPSDFDGCRGGCHSGDCLTNTGSLHGYSDYAAMSHRQVVNGPQVVRPVRHPKPGSPCRFSSMSELFD